MSDEGVAYVRKSSPIQGIGGYKVYEHVISNVEVTGKNTFALVIAPPSGVHVQFLIWEVCVLFYMYPINFTALSIIVELQ